MKTLQEQILINFSDGPKVEVLGNKSGSYKIEFIDKSTNKVVHNSTIKSNMWTKCNKKWNIPWLIRINNQDKFDFNLAGKNVRVRLESKSVGDTLAWTPQIIEFANLYKCNVTLSTFHNEWFENLPAYKDIKFVPPGTEGKYYAEYKIGWFMVDDKWDEGSYHPKQPNTIPLIQTATDILGLPYKEINHGIDFKPKLKPMPSKYICIGPKSTAGLKEWPAHYWERLAKLLNDKGYQVINISYEGFSCKGVIDRKELNWEDTYNYLYHADLFIGLGSGLSWFNWAMGKHTVMINNFIPYGYEFTHNLTKVEDYSVCNNCWVDPRHQFNKGKWNWCPRHQNTLSEHICHKALKPEIVFEKVMQVLKFK